MRTKWGQNFLVDEGYCRRIAASVEAGPEDHLLEVGPGRGALTVHFMERTASLTLVEKDAALADTLRRRWGSYRGLVIHQADFLDWPLPEVPPRSVKFVSNLPYESAAAILRKLLDWPGLARAVVMVQKEVAERMVAGPGGKDYGVLSLAVQVKAKPKILFDVPPGAFKPKPQVVSTVMEIVPLDASRTSDEAAFFRVVKAAFGQRRKMILNSLAHGLGVEREVSGAALAAAGINPDSRAEVLPLEKFEALAQAIGRSTQST